ncbi:MAG: hypothetical protein NC124_10765 [Clostridium sp.]|nr:hypothetical protein [Clostridium sp.]
MYMNEILFADKFLAKLKVMGKNSIPFKTRDYKNGIQAMKIYFFEHEDELDEGLSDIGMIFLNGGQRDFADAIMQANGDRISLKNPNLEVATIQMEPERVKMVLEDEELGISDMFITEITKVFCDAAHI